MEDLISKDYIDIVYKKAKLQWKSGVSMTIPVMKWI
jgi:hypothetical protein